LGPEDQKRARVTALFPMAGQGARFGYTFKPFLTVGEETFIEAAVRPFRARIAEIKELVFVYLAEQEAAFSVKARLDRMFSDLPHRVVLLEQPTKGPAETIAKACEKANITGAVTICDCDHALDVGPLFDLVAATATTSYACAIPVWPLDEREVHAWSVARMDPDGRVLAIAEKSVPPGSGATAGVIGCYVFPKIEETVRVAKGIGATNFSDVIQHALREGGIVRAVPIAKAEFFGDPARLNATLEKRHTEKA
jgi:NDP-sugar pyrophosphorylase family protein